MRLRMGALLCVLTVTAAAETKVTMASLPPAVQNAIQAELKGRQLVSLSRETENHKTFYEAETKVSGKSCDILFDAAGSVVEVEQEVELSEVPDGARAAIQKQAGKAKITKVEAITKGGKLVAYEASVAKGIRTSEIAVTPEGAPYKD